jgi:hypothetical protein
MGKKKIKHRSPLSITGKRASVIKIWVLGLFGVF